MEPLWELRAVKELALLGLHGAQGSARAAANGALGEGGTAERAVLLGLGAVVREGVRECPGGRGRVRMRRVVDGFCGLSATERVGRDEVELTRHGASANEADEGGVNGVTESEGRAHCVRLRVED